MNRLERFRIRYKEANNKACNAATLRPTNRLPLQWNRRGSEVALTGKPPPGGLSAAGQNHYTLILLPKRFLKIDFGSYITCRKEAV
jgi:hypothetical protein